jgi:hypothetical protein
MARIFARSPYIINIDELNQSGSKIDLTIWQGSGSAPMNPTYILSKDSPSTTNTQTVYNISPYIQEFLNHNTNQSIYNGFINTPVDQWVNVKVTKYKKNLAGAYSVLGTEDFKAYNGYGLFVEGYNPQQTSWFLPEGTYNYYYNPNADFFNNPLDRVGHLTLEAISGWKMKYTNLVTAATFTIPFTTTRVTDVYRVPQSYYLDGCITVLLNASDAIQAKWTFRPVIECRYEPVVIDFVNKLGAWQREFFFKASFDDIEVKSNAYNLMMANSVNYSVVQGQRKDFNVNASEKIKVNTGSVTENYYDVLTDLIMSERILVNGLPATIKTKGLSKLKGINTKDSNYTLEFEYAYNTINNVI